MSFARKTISHDTQLGFYDTLSYVLYQLRRTHVGQRMTVTVSFDWKTATTLAREAVQHWLASPPHRATLLHGAYSRQGIGVASSDNFRVYITQHLCP